MLFHLLLENLALIDTLRLLSPWPVLYYTITRYSDFLHQLRLQLRLLLRLQLWLQRQLQFRPWHWLYPICCRAQGLRLRVRLNVNNHNIMTQQGQTSLPI